MKNFPKKKIKAFIYIGGSYPQIQGVKAIKKSGLFVILIDRNSNSPCSKYVDLHLRVDALEIEKIKKKLMQYILNYEFLGIYGIGDFANDTISKLNVFLKINNNNNNDILTSFTNKINTHKIWSKLNLPKTKLLWSGKKVPTDKNLTYILKESNKIVIKTSSSN